MERNKRRAHHHPTSLRRQGSMRSNRTLRAMGPCLRRGAGSSLRHPGICQSKYPGPRSRETQSGPPWIPACAGMTIGEVNGIKINRGRSGCGDDWGSGGRGKPASDRAIFTAALNMPVATLSTRLFFVSFQSLNHMRPNLTRHRPRTIVRAVFRGVDFDRSAHPFWGVCYGR